MPTSEKQIVANQRNARYSSGPATAEGKARAALNALKHGVLSTRLVLQHECADEFQNLFDALVTSLRPVGSLEHVLVEKIATNLWRQKRLSAAEAATIEMQTRNEAIASVVSAAWYGPFSASEFTADDLDEPVEDHIQWCRSVLDESNSIAPGAIHDWQGLTEPAPVIYNQLLEDAQNEAMPVAAYLDLLDDGLSEYLGDLVQYCRAEIEKVNERPGILQLAKWVRAKMSVVEGEFGDRLARYRTTLDNELYKALKELREVQRWRLEAIENQADQGDRPGAHRAAA